MSVVTLSYTGILHDPLLDQVLQYFVFSAGLERHGSYTVEVVGHARIRVALKILGCTALFHSRLCQLLELLRPMGKIGLSFLKE